jgi:hypothetical protein
MQSFKLLGSIGLATLFAGYGCSVEVTETTGAAGGTGGAGSTSTVVGPGPTTAVGPMSSSSTGMPPTDESTGCENAVELAAGMNSMSGVKYLAAEAILAVAEDKDYFKFTAKKGDWINLGTEGGGDGDPAIVDPVVTLFSADGKTKFAEVDDSFPRIDTNSNFDFRIPADGTYCVEVQEFSTWKNVDPKKGDDTLAYALVVVPYDADNLKVLKGLELDKEPNDDVAGAQTMSNLNTLQSGQVADFPFGALEPKTDKDIFKFTTPKGAIGLSMSFAPSGATGNGSTGNIGLVNVWNSDATELLAQLDYNDATAQISAGGSYGMSSVPVLESTTYLFEINRKAGAEVGTNDFYFFKSFTSDTLNPQETDNTKNATATGAEVTMAQENMADPKFTNRFLGGSIPAGDVDFWKFEANANDKIIVVCSSRRAGSGVEDFTVDLLDSTEKSLQVETEKPAADLYWSNEGETASKPAVTAKAGTYYVKLSSTKMVMGGAESSHYLCGVHTQAP